MCPALFESTKVQVLTRAAVPMLTNPVMSIQDSRLPFLPPMFEDKPQCFHTTLSDSHSMEVSVTCLLAAIIPCLIHLSAQTRTYMAFGTLVASQLGIVLG